MTPAEPPHNPAPPAWADRLLTWACPATLREELLGDLHEQFEQQVAEFGVAKARRLYVWEVIRFCRPYFIRRRMASQPQAVYDYPQPFTANPVMIQNYLKIAWRNLVRHKTFSAINILGLVLGMASSLLILLWVQHERSVDHFNINRSRLYQVFEN